jgi:hypothetical protein
VAATRRFDETVVAITLNFTTKRDAFARTLRVKQRLLDLAQREYRRVRCSEQIFDDFANGR